MEECKVIAIANEKGGVGKTTTTVNLGIGLSKLGYQVLLIDADPQGSLSLSLGISRPDELDVSLATLMKAAMDDKHLPEETGIIHHSEGVDLIPSNIELSGIETGLVNMMSREYVLKEVIQSLKPAYDYMHAIFVPVQDWAQKSFMNQIPAIMNTMRIILRNQSMKS